MIKLLDRLCPAFTFIAAIVVGAMATAATLIAILVGLAFVLFFGALALSVGIVCAAAGAVYLGLVVFRSMRADGW